MARTESPAGNVSPEHNPVEEWFRQNCALKEATDAADHAWRERFQSEASSHLTLSLAWIRRARRVHALVGYATMVSGVVVCYGLTFLSLATALAASPAVSSLAPGLPRSLGRFTPFIVATVAASLFVGFHKLAYSFLAARERTLSENEARYLAYAVSVATGREHRSSPADASSSTLRQQEQPCGDK